LSGVTFPQDVIDQILLKSDDTSQDYSKQTDRDKEGGRETQGENGRMERRRKTKRGWEGGKERERELVHS